MNHNDARGIETKNGHEWLQGQKNVRGVRGRVVLSEEETEEDEEIIPTQRPSPNDSEDDDDAHLDDARGMTSIMKRTLNAG